jgi:alpha-galactosidase
MASMARPDLFVHLRSSGVSLLLDCTDGQLPAVMHWGADLGVLEDADVRTIAAVSLEPVAPNGPDVPARLSVLPEGWRGWVGRPGVEGHRAGGDWSPRFVTTDIEIDGLSVRDDFAADRRPSLVATEAALVTVFGHDPDTALDVRVEIEMLLSGLVRIRAAVRNAGKGAEPYEVLGVTPTLPIPPRAREILDFAGRWGLERTPQRSVLQVGVHERLGRRGRTGADAATVLTVGEPGFGFARGEVWGVHTAWSGNHRHAAERLSTGAQTLAGGELLLPGEVRLAPGDEYVSPWVYGAYGHGLDDQAARFHRYLRARPSHPVRPRPVTINVWEAVYFDHDLARLVDLAERAAAIGVERYVLDDGWFRHRRNDRAGLGDWFVDESVWPDGLTPLVDRVRGLGMEFGLWFEPEMVNEDSDLARAHPDWIMQVPGRLPVRSRNQQVLDLTNPEAFAYIFDRMTAVIGEYGIEYIKWDHNRDLVESGDAHGRPGVHGQTLAVYRLMAMLKERFPALEIESCSSGGSRVDLGVLEYTDRVWVSDCIDPLDRQSMMRWTGQLLPPELLGAHIASGVSHTTGRSHTVAFRAGTAFPGHLGIEWDLARASAEELAELTAWVALHKRHRALLHHGVVVRVDQPEPTLYVSGVVAPDRAEAIFQVATIGRAEVSPRGRATLSGLHPDRQYRISPVVVDGANVGVDPSPWWATASADPIGGAPVMSGRVLQNVGIELPLLLPERIAMLHLVALG